MQETSNEPKRDIYFSIDEYKDFEQSLIKARRARYLFIQGRKVVNVDHRAAESRDEKLCVGRFTAKNLPHYEGVLSKINKVALAYEYEVSQI